MSKLKTANMRSVYSLFPSPNRAWFTPPYPLMCKLAKRQMFPFELTKFSTWITDFKQKYKSIFSAHSNPRNTAASTKTLSFSHSCIFAFENFLLQSSNCSSYHWFLLHLDSIWNLSQAPNLNCSEGFVLLFFKLFQWWKEIWRVPSFAEPNNLKDSSLQSIIFICLHLNHSKNHCFTNCFKIK